MALPPILGLLAILLPLIYLSPVLGVSASTLLGFLVFSLDTQRKQSMKPLVKQEVSLYQPLRFRPS